MDTKAMYDRAKQALVDNGSDEVTYLASDVADLTREVDRLREALEFYAAEHTDDGECARAALLGK